MIMKHKGQKPVHKSSVRFILSIWMDYKCFKVNWLVLCIFTKKDTTHTKMTSFIPEKQFFNVEKTFFLLVQLQRTKRMVVTFY